MVGSSSSSRSGSANSTEASATRMRQPPEKDDAGRCCASVSKPRPARIVAARASAEWASMSASRMWISAMRCGSVAVCSSVISASRSRIGLEHDLDQRLLGARRFLRDLADAHVLGQADRACLGRHLAGDGVEQRGLAGAVAADEPGLRPGRQGHRGMVEQKASGDAERKIVDDEHGGRLMADRRREGKGR